jgi:spore coat protein U-like protein
MRLSRLILPLWLALGLGTRAQAAVSFSCLVRATSIVFGVYNPLNTVATQSTGSWTVTCTAGGSGSATVTGTVSLSTGSSGSFFPRKMAAGANTLTYNIYTSSADAQIMGDGTGGTSQLSGSGTVSSGQPFIVSGTMYGNLPPLQDVAPGSYTDALILTVAY